jgi:hypothetical protein
MSEPSELVLLNANNRLVIAANNRGCVIRFQEKKENDVHVYEWECSSLNEMKKVCVGYTQFMLDDMNWSEYVSHFNRYLDNKLSPQIRYKITRVGNNLLLGIDEEHYVSYDVFRQHRLITLPMKFVKSSDSFLDDIDSNSIFVGNAEIEVHNNFHYEYDFGGRVILDIDHENKTLIVIFRSNKVYYKLFDAQELKKCFMVKNHNGTFEECVKKIKFVFGNGSGSEQACYCAPSLRICDNVAIITGSKYYRYDDDDNPIFKLTLDYMPDFFIL